MKQLPEFHTKPEFQSLFKEMDTKYSEFNSIEWEANGDSIVSEILRTGEALIENEKLSDYIEDDGYFRVNNKTVLVYIKNQYERFWNQDEGESKYRYHLYKCTTLDDAINKSRKARYVLRDPVISQGRGDDIFEINLTAGNEIVKTIKEKLKVCKNCLKGLNFENYKDKTGTEQNEAWHSFDYKEFFEVHEIQRLAQINFQDYRQAQKNEYPKNFSEISNKYREDKDWTCEECHIYLGDESNKKYLHTHHIDHQKSNNSTLNFRALCIECHSEISHHGFLKNNPDYDEYLLIR